MAEWCGWRRHLCAEPLSRAAKKSRVAGACFQKRRTGLSLSRRKRLIGILGQDNLNHRVPDSEVRSLASRRLSGVPYPTTAR